MGQSHGFSLFSTVEDAMQFYDAVEAHERDERVALPSHIMFSFDDRNQVPARLLEEIDDHGWVVANETAYPLPLAVDPDLVTRALTRDELAGVTAIMTALAELVESEPEDLAAAWDDDEDADDEEGAVEITWNRTVQTRRGDVAIELRAPITMPHDHQAMVNVDTMLDDDGKIDAEVLGDFIHALVHELEEVPGIDEMHLRCAEVLIVQAAKSFGLPITQLTGAAMHDLLFRELPSGVPLEPGLAPFVLDAAQLIMAYADETLGIASATECRAMLSQPGLPDELARVFGTATKAMSGHKKPPAKKAAAKAPAKKAAAKAKKPATMKPATKRPAMKAAAKGKKPAAKKPATKPATTKKSATKTKRR
jgi:hypothetical protein